MSAIRLEQVRKSYGNVVAVHGVDLTIDDGEFVVFLGPSGCGKSTTLRMIAGLEETTSGKIMIGSTLIALPLFAAFALLTQYFIQGLGAGAVKG